MGNKRSIARDNNLVAMGKGERTSKKVSTIMKSDGTTFRLKNANQYGKAEGGNDYTEKRINRSDIYEKGGFINKINQDDNLDYFIMYYDDEIHYKWYNMGMTTENALADIENYHGIVYDENKDYMEKYKRDKKQITNRGRYNENDFATGGIIGGFNYSIGGL